MNVELKIRFRGQDSLRNDAQDRAQQANPEHNAECAANQCKKQRLEEKLHEDAGAAGSHGSSDGNFPQARRSLGKQQIGDIHACDQQHESDSSKQKPQVADALFRQEIVLQRLD